LLVLTRKERERIHIGPDIVIAIQRIDRNQVRIAIEAPKEVVILRGELVERNERQEREEAKRR